MSYEIYLLCFVSPAIRIVYVRESQFYEQTGSCDFILVAQSIGRREVGLKISDFFSLPVTFKHFGNELVKLLRF